MEKIAALYLAHLNPVTNAHEKIISHLSEKYYRVYVFPVIFLNKGNEVNTRTFPFPYNLRKLMLKKLFERNNNIQILPDYVFFSPYVKYLPPLISPYSWTLRRQILKDVKERRFISYTGDKAERIALKLYNLHPIKTNRLQISASEVKEMIYKQVMTKNKDKENSTVLWKKLVPLEVAELIEENWSIVEKFAHSTDNTIKIMGMKFPVEGIFHL